MSWASRNSLASFPFVGLFCLSLAACEQDPTPTREPGPAAPATPAAASPVAQNAPPGVCADEPGKPHCGCGSMCSGKCGDSCANGAQAAAGCDDPAKPPPAVQAGGCGCGSKGAAQAPAPSGPIIENGRAQIGDRTMCPVMSSPFVIKPDSPKTDYQGKTYYFCCEGCVDQFKKKPESFI